MRFNNRIVVGVLLLVAIEIVAEQWTRSSDLEGGLRRPPAQAEALPPDDAWRDVEEGPALPDIRGSEPAFNVDIPRRPEEGLGTAFSIAPGVWLTARHVVDSCRHVYVARQPVRRGYVDKAADVAVLRAALDSPQLPFAEGGLRLNQQGFHFGFPGGEPGQVTTRLMGRMVMRARGRYRTREPVLAWAEEARVPNVRGSLGGISGGPTLNAEGKVIGINAAGSVRRGRLFTVAPVSVERALREAKAAPEMRRAAASTGIDGRTFAAFGDRLRGQRAVSPVLCFVD